MELTLSKNKIIGAVIGVIVLIFFLIANPFSYNDSGNRTVVQQYGGKQFVQFTPGVFYSGFWARDVEWPNQISVTYQKDEADYTMVDNGIEIGKIQIMFNDGTTAKITGITQYILPADEKDMILLNNTHRTPQSLVSKRLSMFTTECLQASAQTMSSDKHYGGGRAQMAQDFLDQLRHGVFLSSTEEKVIYDSIEHEKKRLYLTVVKIGKDGLPLRKSSGIAEYNITVADASAVNAEYEGKVKEKLAKIIEASSKAAISRQDLMTAQQQALTAKATGEKELVEIEYKQKQEQTKQVVQAETKVKVAEQDKLQKQIAYEASVIEAKSIKELAQARAFEKRSNMEADGALQPRLDARVKIHQAWAEAFAKYTGAIVPQFQTGSGVMAQNGAMQFMEVVAAKAAKDFSEDIKVK